MASGILQDYCVRGHPYYMFRPLEVGSIVSDEAFIGLGKVSRNLG